ncbi:hypothetical protein CWI39_0274p0020 [Hamiltosporidium magnivora]|uniref:Uncharacterized protein n=1 Tax=Hamiltosporidium magnivora TaxID=148818 RepID=A0A4Q9LI49_9MICR|nr:hypothetical protein CWI39_0274p0020 [Hamiltosporidium magnivora]
MHEANETNVENLTNTISLFRKKPSKIIFQKFLFNPATMIFLNEYVFEENLISIIFLDYEVINNQIKFSEKILNIKKIVFFNYKHSLVENIFADDNAMSKAKSFLEHDMIYNLKMSNINLKYLMRDDSLFSHMWIISSNYPYIYLLSFHIDLGNVLIYRIFEYKFLYWKITGIILEKTSNEPNSNSKTKNIGMNLDSICFLNLEINLFQVKIFNLSFTNKYISDNIFFFENFGFNN